jgi:hypothetical protein
MKWVQDELITYLTTHIHHSNSIDFANQRDIPMRDDVAKP